MARITNSICLALCLAVADLAAAGQAQLEVKDTAGVIHKPLELPAGRKAAVFVFITHECPIANAYAPELKRIAETYGAKDFAFYLVHVDPDQTADAAAKHAKEFGHTCTVLLDPRHALVTRLGAKSVPEAAVVGADGRVLYRGRIDDRFVSYGKQRAEPTERDLRTALDAIAAGKAVPVPETKAIGCIIAPLSKERKP